MEGCGGAAPHATPFAAACFSVSKMTTSTDLSDRYTKVGLRVILDTSLVIVALPPVYLIKRHLYETAELLESSLCKQIDR